MSAWDILPLHWGKILVFFLLGSGIIVGLEYLYWTRLDWSIQLNVEQLPIFDFAVPGNLSAWFSSGLWLFAAAMCLVAFLIGRKQEKTHRLSDIWLWAAFGSFLLSADAVCQVKDFIRIVLIHFSGTALYAQGEIWWIAVYVFLFGTIGSRLLVEMRHYLLACNIFFIAALSSLIACCIPLNLVKFPFEDARAPIMLRSGLEMSGALFAVLAFSLFVRRMLIVYRNTQQISSQNMENLPKPTLCEQKPNVPESKKTQEIVKPQIHTPLFSTSQKGNEEKNFQKDKEKLKIQEKAKDKEHEKPKKEKKTTDDSSNEEEPIFIPIEEENSESEKVENGEDNEYNKNIGNDIDEKTKEKGTSEKRSIRTFQIVHPSPGGEKIVKVEKIEEPDEEEPEKKPSRKKDDSKKHEQPKQADDDLLDEDFDLDEDEEEQLRELLLKLKRKKQQQKAG